MTTPSILQTPSKHHPLYRINETALQDRVCEQFLVQLQSYIDSHVTPNSHLYTTQVKFTVDSCSAINDSKSTSSIVEITLTVIANSIQNFDEPDRKFSKKVEQNFNQIVNGHQIIIE